LSRLTAHALSTPPRRRTPRFLTRRRLKRRRRGGRRDAERGPPSPVALRAQVLSLLAHAHWVTSATYNRFHDQLLLSCGTDSQVKLWRG